METVIRADGTGYSPAMRALIDQVRAAVRSDGGPGAIARGVAGVLRPFLDRHDLLLPVQRQADSTKYRQHVIHVEPDGIFSVVSLVWLPGQSTPIHDHVSWCVVGVHQGREHEIRYRLVEDGVAAHLEESGDGFNRAGSTAALTPPGDIHRVMNPGPEAAISLHIYGADIAALGSSIRRCYYLPIRDRAPTEHGGA
jgi:predicted metal-dependent enzyme (double-stranded beta helix superfamily)